MSDSYTVKDIQVLKGLEAVRKRPGMYIGGTSLTGLHQLVWEILDNSVDEALNGHCNRIEVTLGADGGITVVDHGRGIPVEEHPTTGKNSVETIFCNLHAGGKFDDDAYKVAGGLHGVGASVVNALSEALIVEVKRNGHCYRQEFSRGNPTSPLRDAGAARGTGTKITFRPDPEIFPDRTFSKELIKERLETKAFLMAGLRVRLKDEAEGTAEEYIYPGGITDFLQKLLQGRAVIDAQPLHYRSENGLRFEMALAWTFDTTTRILSFVNSIPTPKAAPTRLPFAMGSPVRCAPTWRSATVFPRVSRGSPRTMCGKAWWPSCRSISRATWNSRARPRSALTARCRNRSSRWCALPSRRGFTRIRLRPQR